MKILRFILIITLTVIVGITIAWFGFLKPKPPPILPEDRAQIMIMPLPAELTLSDGQFLIDSDFGFALKNVSTPKLIRAIDRFYTKLELQTGISFSNKSEQKLILDCHNKGDKYPSVNDNESYSLSVNDQKISLSANSETGILYSLESLFQLVKFKDGQWIIPTLKLKDEPRYPWRGLMIDVARHWVPKEVILRNLDAMASVKMNVLHWHLTDYQGFRIESKIYPKLHKKGSDGDYYTQEDIKEVINYAADRGIRVIPEFDVPGHTTAWFVGYPELATVQRTYVLDSVFGILDPVMDPTQDKVYDFLDHFIGEMAALFPDEYIHIGGDEVNPKQWEENKGIQEYMADKRISDPHELQAHFNIRLQKIIEKYGKKMMGWDEIIHPDLPKNNIAVQSWRNQKSLWEAARNGNKSVLSAGYYLDYKQPAAFHYKVDPTVITGAVSIEIDTANWKSWDCKMYVREMEIESSLYLFGKNDNLRGIMSSMDGASDFTDITVNNGILAFDYESPFGAINYKLKMKGDSINGEAKVALFTIDIKGKKTGGSDMVGGKPLPKFEKIEPLTPEQTRNILGGEACMWSEMVDKRTIESRIWPRAAAIAEKLWSPKELTKNDTDMYRRLIKLDDRLAKLGLRDQASSDEIISEMVEKPYIVPLRTLVSVLQEDKFFNRMTIYEPELYTSTPLNRIVDAARPESYVAYQFNHWVDLWLETKNKETEAIIVEYLKNWSKNYDELSPAFENTERLKEVEPHSRQLSELSKLGLIAIRDPKSLSNMKTKIDSLLKNATQSYGGTILSVESGLRKIISEAK